MQQRLSRKDIISFRLMVMPVSSEIRVSNYQRTTLHHEIQDMTLFHKRKYKTRTDKGKAEIVITRLR